MLQDIAISTFLRAILLVFVIIKKLIPSEGESQYNVRDNLLLSLDFKLLQKRLVSG